MVVSGWIHEQARRANRNLLLVNGFILAVFLFIAIVNGRYFYNFVRGSERVQPAELALLTSPDQRTRNFITVSGDKSVSTGYQDVERKVEKATGRVISTEVKDEYVLLRIGTRVLLVKARPGPERLEYSGALIATPASVQHDLVQRWTKEDPKFAAMLLPFTLDAADYRDLGIGYLVLAVPFCLLAVWNCLKALRRSGNEADMPLIKQLAAYGSPEKLAMDIEAERQMPKDRYGEMEVMRSWITRKFLFSTWICPLDDLVWVYKKVTKHSVYFIPTGKTFAVILIGGHGRRIEVNLGEPMSNHLLTSLAARTPWTVFGYSSEIEALWRKDRRGFVNAVAERRRRQQGSAHA